MKVILTSFGLGAEANSSTIEESLFRNMPPVSMRPFNKMFAPNYEVLLLCQKIIIDESTFEKIKEKSPKPYSLVSDTINALYSEGYIELADFSSILDRERVLVEKMLEQDLRLVDQWVEPLRNSREIWQHFSNDVADFVIEDQDGLDEIAGRRKYLDDEISSGVQRGLR